MFSTIGRLRGRAVMARISALAPAVALAACATADRAATARPPPALEMPAGWSMAASAPVPPPLAMWWQRFEDPLLVSLVDDALRANTSVRSAVAALAQSRALAAVQEAALWPSLRGSASAQRSRQGAGTGAVAASAFNAGFDASWEIDVFGGQRAAVSAAQADVQAGAASLADVQVSVAAEVAVSYMQLRGLQERLLIAQANLRSQDETLQITQWRAQAGLLTALEVEQARAVAAQTRALLPALQTAAAQAEHSLAVLTRRPPAALHERLAAAGDGRSTLTTPGVTLVLAFPAQTLQQRPDVRAAEARVDGAAARVTQADAARLPSFQLSGSLGLSALTFGTLGQGSSLLATLLASVGVPLIDGGALRAQARAQRAALEQAAAALDAAVLAALQDVEDSLAALAGDRLRLQSLSVAADAADSAAALAQMRYASGLVDFQVVLDTQRTALTTQDARAGSAADLNADHVRLFKALGGGWEPSDLARQVGVAARQPLGGSP